MRRLWVIFLAIFVTACAPSSLQECCEHGEAITLDIARELEKCHSREDLQKSIPRLKKQFMRLVDIIIEASLHQGEPPAFTDGRAGDKLLFEMQRVYLIEGGRQLVELAQREALEKLDAFDQRHKKGKI